jgi:hypothetical protein
VCSCSLWHHFGSKGATVSLYPSSLADPMNHSNAQPKRGGSNAVISDSSNISKPSFRKQYLFLLFTVSLFFHLPNLPGITSAQW